MMLTPFNRPLLLLALVALVCWGLGCGAALEDVVEAEDVVAADDSVGFAESALTGDVAVGSTLKTTTGLNLRTGGSTAFAVILVMPAGASVTAVQSAPQNGWYNIKYGTSTGWASGTYLTAVTAAPPSGGGTVSIFQGPVVAHAQRFANAACTAVGCPFVLQTRPGHSPTQVQAIDFMLSTGGKMPSDGGVRGDNLAGYGLGNFGAYKLQYLIWKQRINSSDGRGWRAMADRGSITANHFDHVHISYNP